MKLWAAIRKTEYHNIYILKYGCSLFWDKRQTNRQGELSRRGYVLGWSVGPSDSKDGPRFSNQQQVCHLRTS